MVTFLFHLSGLLTPGVEIRIGNAPGFDPGKPFLIFLTVGFEYRIVRLLLCPLLEGSSLTAGLLPSGHRTLTVLRADPSGLGEVAAAVLAAPHRNTPVSYTHLDVYKRQAYITAIEESPEIASIPFEELTSGQMLLIVQKSMVNVVCGRILNDIGNKIIMLPDDIDVAEKLVVQIKEFVTGAISDAVSDLKVDVNNLSQHQSIDIVDEVYRTAFEIMARAGDNE